MATTSPIKRHVGRLMLEWVPRVLVAALFVYTGSTKIVDPQTFVKEVRAYELIPNLWSNPLAYVLPWLEVFAGLLLLSGLWRAEARLLLAGMLIAFAGVKGYVLALGREIDCGCVPTASAIHFLFDGPIGVVTNIVLLAFLGVEAYCQRLRRKLARATKPPIEQQEAVPA